MAKNSLIIITGLPGTGKTTLGKKLAKDLGIPFISKDNFKEILFDVFGWQDREWSKKIGGASYDLMYHVAESILESGKPLIVETNFNPKFANQKFLELKEKYDLALVQVRCVTDGEVLFERFKKRAESADRHPGHVDGGSLDEWRPILLQGKIESLDIGSEILDVDTTDFEKIDHKKLLEYIKAKIQ